MPYRRAFEFVQDRTAGVEPAHVERALPDYTWLQRVPIEQLRRAIEREVREAADMVAKTFPT